MFEGTEEMSGEEMTIRLGREMLLDFINKENQRRAGSSHFLDLNKNIHKDFKVDELTDKDLLVAYKMFTEQIDETEFKEYRAKTMQELNARPSASRNIFLQAMSNLSIPISFKRSKIKKK